MHKMLPKLKIPKEHSLSTQYAILEGVGKIEPATMRIKSGSPRSLLLGRQQGEVEHWLGQLSPGKKKKLRERIALIKRGAVGRVAPMGAEAGEFTAAAAALSVPRMKLPPSAVKPLAKPSRQADFQHIPLPRKKPLSMRLPHGIAAAAITPCSMFQPCFNKNQCW